MLTTLFYIFLIIILLSGINYYGLYGEDFILRKKPDINYYKLENKNYKNTILLIPSELYNNRYAHERFINMFSIIHVMNYDSIPSPSLLDNNIKFEFKRKVQYIFYCKYIIDEEFLSELMYRIKDYKKKSDKCLPVITKRKFEIGDKFVLEDNCDLYMFAENSPIMDCFDFLLMPYQNPLQRQKKIPKFIFDISAYMECENPEIMMVGIYVLTLWGYVVWQLS